jgi:hypothetical protein
MAILSEATTAQPNSTGGGIDWASIIPGLANAGLDLYSIFGKGPQNTINNAMNVADPRLPLQGQARDQLSAFLTDPSSVLKDPAFLAAENLGAENISRQAGAAGMANSGNRLADLFKYGETAGLNYEQQRFNQLMSILQPANTGAANIALGGAQGKTSAISDLIKTLFGGAGGQVPGLASQLIKFFSGGGGPDLTSLLTSGGINAGSLDTGGTLSDLQTIDYGGGSGLGDFFTGGSGDMFQMIDVLGG